MIGLDFQGYTETSFSYPEPCSRWARARLFLGSKAPPGTTGMWSDGEALNEEMDELQRQIEQTLARREPDIEVIALERPSGDALRLFIDRPDGVDLGDCERVTDHLRDLLQTYSLEVSSPGLDRPLTKPEHFRRFLGRRIRVRTREEIEGRRSFTGTLTAADERSVRVDPGGGPVVIPLDRVRRSNLVPDPPEVTA